MTFEEAQTILQPIHALEQKERRMFGRKELHKHLPEGLSFEDKHTLIKYWQSGYMDRFHHVWHHQMHGWRYKKA